MEIEVRGPREASDLKRLKVLEGEVAHHKRMSSASIDYKSVKLVTKL